MFLKNGVDFNWSTLFKLNEQKKQWEIADISQLKCEYSPESLVYLLGFADAQEKEAYIKACEIEALSFCIKDSDFAKDILNDDDYVKALNLFERKQYSSKLLKDILAKFCVLLRRCERNEELLKAKECFKVFLERDIYRTAKAISDETVEKSFSPLKKEIEKIASGVKSVCYFIADKDNYFEKEADIRKDLNEILLEDFGIKGEPVNTYNSGETLNEAIYKRALLDDVEFWAKHEKFRVSTFIDAIYKYNDEKHAKKVWAYIFDKIRENEIGARLLENKLPVKFLFKDKIFNSLKGRFFKCFDRFEGVYDLNIIKDEACCYPFTKTEGVEEKIASGKDIMGGFFKSVYPSDSEKVIDFFNEQINGGEPYRAGYSTVKDLFIGYTSRLWFDDDERKAVLVYCPEYFSVENIWSRLYLIAYAAHMLESNIDKCYANLFEIFYDLFKAVEGKFGLKTTYQRDTGSRENAYSELKKILKKYGLNISDGFKNDYITALLDRKVAVMEEIERFPALEQLGDAVYGLAVAEMMFYQPADIEDECIFKDYDNYICANAQVEICRTLGLDKLYISPLSLSYKYSRQTWVAPDDELFLLRQETGDRDCKFKFLADSLEMVIGTVCKDLGYQVAIDFTKRIVKEQFPDVFKKEVRWENRYDTDHDPEIDWEYWNRIKPAPCPVFETYSSKRYIDKMWDAFDKFMLAYSLGTEDKEVRISITQWYHREKYDKLYGIKNLRYQDFNCAMYEYLHNGLAYMVENYSEKIKENYKNLKDE